MWYGFRNFCFWQSQEAHAIDEWLRYTGPSNSSSAFTFSDHKTLSCMLRWWVPHRWTKGCKPHLSTPAPHEYRKTVATSKFSFPIFSKRRWSERPYAPHPPSLTRVKCMVGTAHSAGKSPTTSIIHMCKRPNIFSSFRVYCGRWEVIKWPISESLGRHYLRFNITAETIFCHLQPGLESNTVGLFLQHTTTVKIT